MSFARKTASDFFKDEEPTVESPMLVDNSKGESNLNKKENYGKIKNETLDKETEAKKTDSKKNKVQVEVELDSPSPSPRDHDHDHDKNKDKDIENIPKNETKELETTTNKFTSYNSYPCDQTINPSSIPQLTLTPDQVQYQRYMQQCQQYQQYQQQYYAQYYNQAVLSSTITTTDPAYEFFTSSNSNNPTTTSYDSTRASRQLTSFFDPTKFHSVLSPEMQALQQSQKHQQQAKLTGKEIEAFKKRKVEKKKAKNKWLYE